MAIEARSATDALKARLLDSGERFSFFQAYRLLRRISMLEGKAGETAVKSRPNPSLAFPDRDIHAIVEHGDSNYQLVVNFLGLHGVSSPLPTFYSEQILDDQQENLHAARDFLDIISQTIYPLFFRAWLKSKPHLRIVEFDDSRLLEIFYSFVGINQPERYKGQPGFESLLRFAALYSQSPRSALGLKTILVASFPTVRIDLTEQDIRVLPLATEQQLFLGQQATTLGVDTHIGAEFSCRSSNLTIEMRDVDETLFRQLLPGGLEYRRLQFMVRHYVTDPLNIMLDLYLKAGAVQPIVLGRDSWTGLGRDAWLQDGARANPAHARVEL